MALPPEAFKTTKRPFCKCLYEIENNLPRTMFCFMPCRDQEEIMRQREEAEKRKNEKK